MTHVRARRERGAVNLALLLVGMVLAVAGLVAVATIAIATQAAQHHQNAADAAALAGAEAFEKAGGPKFAPGWLAIRGDLPTMVNQAGACPAQVRAAASKYAELNGTSLTQCAMTRFGQVRVTVRGDVPIDGAGDGEARAEAWWGLDLADCHGDPTFVPDGTPRPTFMRCGSHTLLLMHDGARYTFHPWGQVKKLLEPRLTD